MAYDRYDRDERSRSSDDRSDRNWRGSDNRGGRETIEASGIAQATRSLLGSATTMPSGDDAETRRAKIAMTNTARAKVNEAQLAAVGDPIVTMTPAIVTADLMSAISRATAEAVPTAISIMIAAFSIAAVRASATTIAAGSAIYRKIATGKLTRTASGNAVEPRARTADLRAIAITDRWRRLWSKRPFVRSIFGSRKVRPLKPFVGRL